MNMQHLKFKTIFIDRCSEITDSVTSIMKCKIIDESCFNKIYCNEYPTNTFLYIIVNDCSEHFRNICNRGHCHLKSEVIVQFPQNISYIPNNNYSYTIFTSFKLSAPTPYIPNIILIMEWHNFTDWLCYMRVTTAFKHIKRHALLSQPGVF